MIQKLYTSLKYSLSGLKLCFKHESSFRMEVALFILNISSFFWFDFTKWEMMSLTIILLFIMSLELLNSGIEKLSDLITKEFHPLIQYAKDVSSAAIFLGFIAYSIVLLFILI
jgi:diacylglycerol kinase (ATP)